MGCHSSWWKCLYALAIAVQIGSLTAGISQAQTSGTTAPRFAFGSNYGPAGRSGIYTYSVNSSTLQLHLADYLEISGLGSGTGILAVDPNGKFAYTFTQNPTTQLLEIMGVQISQASGSLTPIPGAPFACLCFAGITSYYESLTSIIAFDPSGKFLYTVSGSGSEPDSIIAFAIDPSTGALSGVPGAPFSAGSGTSAIVIDPSGSFLYATNGNDGTISAYSRDTTTGALTEIPGSPFPFAPGSPGLIAIDPAAPFVYVSQFSNALTGGEIAGYAMNTSTGALTALSNPTTAGYLGSMLIDPAGKYLYVGGTIQCDNSGDTICGFSIDGTTGALTPLPASQASQSPGPLQGFDPSGRFIVQREGTGDAFTEPNYVPLQFDSATGALTESFAQQIDIGAPAGMIGGSTPVVTVPAFAYVANSGDNTVSAYSVNAATGALTPISGSPYSTGAAPSAIAADPFGRFLFVANSGSNNVSAFTINQTTGALTAVAGSQFAAGTGPSALVTDPQGELLFVSSSGSNNLLVYSIDQSSGALTPVTGSPFSTGATPAGVFAYGYQGSINLTQFQVIVLNSGANDYSDYVANYLTLGDVIGLGTSISFQGTSPVAGLMDSVYPYQESAAGYYFIVNSGSNDVSMVDLAGVDATNFSTGTNPQSVAIDPTGSFLYVAGGPSGSPGAISAYSLGPLSNGSVPTPISGSPFPAGTSAVSISVDPSGQFAYAVNAGDNTVSAYSIDSSTGALTALSGSPFAAGKSPKSIVIVGALESAPSAPAVALSPASLTFSSEEVGTKSAAQAVTMTNTGNATLSVTGVSVTGANAGDFSQTNTCGSSLAAGAKCTISVTFAPTAAGARSASVSITDNAANSPQSIPLSGTGVAAAPVASLTPAGGLNFASQTIGTTSAAQAITLANTGNASLSISGITLTGADPGDFSETNTCGSSVAAGAKCTISVTFTPAATGTLTASISVADNAAGSPQTSALQGTGTAVPVPVVSLSPTKLTFASQTVGTTSTAQTVTLSNTGTAALTLSGITLTGGDASSYAETNTCGASVAAGSNCTISVTFTPTATGTLTASISVADNASGSPQAVALSGTGAAAPDFSLSASPTTLSMSPGATGTSTLTVTPSNGFSQQVSFACSGLPELASCSFSPTTVTPDGSAATTSVTISTTASTTSRNDVPPMGTQPVRFAASFAGLVFLASLGAIRKRRPLLLTVLGAMVLLGALQGCGGGSKKTIPGTPAGNYTVTVTATSGTGSSALSQTATIALTVQ